MPHREVAMQPVLEEEARPVTPEVDLSGRISKAVEFFESNGYQYRLIGGFIADKLLGKDVDYEEINCGERDVDFLILGNISPEEKIELSKEASDYSGIKVCLSHANAIRLENGKVSLHWRNVEEEAPLRVFDPVKIEIGGEEFDSLAPITLFHMYSVVGYVREKDYPRLMGLGRLIRSSANDSTLTEDDFESFHRFLKEKIKSRAFRAQVSLRKSLGEENYKKLISIPPLKGAMRSVYRTCAWAEESLLKGFSDLLDLGEENE